MKNFIILLLATAFFGCSSTQTIKQISYLGEPAQVEYINMEKQKLPLMVVIPAVYNSLLDQNVLKKLAKGHRLVVIHYISAQDRARAIQVDKLNTRINYYSDIVNQTKAVYGQVDFVVGEGLNASVSARLLANFSFKHAWFINAWKPSLKMQMLNLCFTDPNAQCDSLLSYLKIGSTQNLTALLNNVDSGIDQLIGNYTTYMWQDIIDYRITESLVNNTVPIHWIYTNNTGLITKQQADANARIDLYTVEDFKRAKNLFNN